MVEYAFSALPPSLFDRAAVTSQYEEVLALARERGYLALSNPGAAEGVAAGLRLGLGEMREMDGVLFAVCDQPRLRRESVARLVDAFRAQPGRIAALSFDGRRGNPVIFPRDCYAALLSLTGDTGGGEVIRRNPDRLLLVEAGSAEELEDVDWRE